MHGRGQQPGGGWNRHADEVFSSGPSGIPRLRIGTDVESRQARRSTDEIKKTDESAGMQQLDTPKEVA
jgi:hypothetical protein